MTEVNDNKLYNFFNNNLEKGIDEIQDVIKLKNRMEEIIDSFSNAIANNTKQRAIVKLQKDGDVVFISSNNTQDIKLFSLKILNNNTLEINSLFGYNHNFIKNKVKKECNEELLINTLTEIISSKEFVIMLESISDLLI